MKNINYTKLGLELGVTHSAVSQWFSGKTLPTLDKIFYMKDKYNIPIDAWRDIKNYMKNNS
jgi:transcriptional regulator with XRE-family HTH domain